MIYDCRLMVSFEIEFSAQADEALSAKYSAGQTDQRAWSLTDT